ncbi:MAG: glycoside hydrolase family 36 protein [Treponemataceae bacterium]
MATAGIISKVEHRSGRVCVTYSIGAEQAPERADSLVLDSFPFDALFDLVKLPRANSLRSALWNKRALFVQGGGWQSWSAGWELAWNETLPRRVLVVPELIKYTNRDGDDPKPGEIVGHFISYLRVGDDYLCLASLDGGAHPPLSYRIDRRSKLLTIEVFSRGKEWKPGEVAAKLYVFHAVGFFALKDALRRIYEPERRFSRLSFLKSKDRKRLRPGGFESWYNHYTNIDENLIRADLDALCKTDNLINVFYARRGRPTVFQIDDGWQNTVGEWEIDQSRFPGGLRALSESIHEKGMIPGLWFAPFLVTKKAAIFRERPEWLLKDALGKPVVAGFNDKWDNQFHCLDLSREDVRTYLGGLMDRAIDEWGIRYLKLDFLYAGLLRGVYQNGGAAYEFYDLALKMLTSRTTDNEGRPIAYLGCGLPLGPSYPYFPLSRIGADTKEDWDWAKVKLIGHVGRPSAYVNLLDTIGRSYLDGTVYVNDPDVVFLREKNCRLTENEKELIALVNYLLAGQIMFSDDPVDFGSSSAERFLTERIVGFYDEIPEDEEFGAVRVAKDVFRLESRGGKFAGLINLRARPFRLRRAVDESLFDDLARGTALVDRRLAFESIAQTARKGALNFAPRSITLVRV